MRCTPIIRNAALAVWVMLVLSCVTAGARHQAPTGDELARQVFMLKGGDPADVCGQDAPGVAHHIGHDCLPLHFDDDGILPAPAARASDVDRRLALHLRPLSAQPVDLRAPLFAHPPRASPQVV